MDSTDHIEYAVTIEYEDGTVRTIETDRELPGLMHMAGDGTLDLLIDLLDPNGSTVRTN